uniref:Uncharacterized protein n=1 Tax=viral metagenome TaxID=1070528 RepID=A0A6C0E2A2_9ZZZZ
MNYNLLYKILLEWSLKNKEYEMTNFIYNEFNIGIPVNFLYKLSNKTHFTTLDNLITTSYHKISDSKHLDELLKSFLSSKYGYLDEWNTYGYRKFKRP